MNNAPWRIALNPIQWMATEDGWLDPSLAPPLPEMLRQVKAAGFDHIMTEVPGGMTAAEYRQLLREAELEPAPGYFVCRTNGKDEGDPQLLERARIVAGQHAELGLADVGLGFAMRKGTIRINRPGQGAPDPDGPIDAMIALTGAISEVMIAEGVRLSLHPHIGTWVETEPETRAVLDSFPADRLGLLPDTGHLTWAGVDVPALFRDYADRIPFVHIKDMHREIADRGREQGWGYQETVTAGLWVEPGRGDLDLVGLVGALSPATTRWLMVEVDKPAIADPYESACASAAWMNATFR